MVSTAWRFKTRIRLRTTGDSHGRCMVAEVMGRLAGAYSTVLMTEGAVVAFRDPAEPVVDLVDLA